MSKKERNGVLIKIGESYGGVFVVPEHITALEDDCFSEHSNLEDVILPGSLRSIGSFAFENCASLQKLKIPESVTEIGENAFEGLKRVYYNGPAAGSPWGACEHIFKPKSAAKPAPPPVPPPAPPRPKNTPPAPEPQRPAPAPAPQNRGADPLALLRSAYANKQVGERFDFGRYPQGPNGEADPITWRVLRRDSDSLLVISEYGLDAKAYHDRFAWSGISWSKCSLRSWLNGDFINKAFNAQEQSLIKTTRIGQQCRPRN